MKQETEQLIDALSRQARPIRPMVEPGQLLLQLGGVLLIYMVAAGIIMGFRPDIAAQVVRPFYLAEVTLLLFISVASLFACVCLAFPDEYQHPLAVRLPLLGLAAFILLLAVQPLLPSDPRMVVPPGAAENGGECTECIAFIAVIPSGLMFWFLKRGASVRPNLAGCFAVLAAAAIGCLAVRLKEADDSLLHLAFWHYLPTLAFAALGAWLGKRLLKW